MNYPKVQMLPALNVERANMAFAYPRQDPMQYPGHLRQKRNVDHGMNDAVKTIAGASVAMIGIGTLGALGIGFMGALK